MILNFFLLGTRKSFDHLISDSKAPKRPEMESGITTPPKMRRVAENEYEIGEGHKQVKWFSMFASIYNFLFSLDRIPKNPTSPPAEGLCVWVQHPAKWGSSHRSQNPGAASYSTGNVFLSQNELGTLVSLPHSQMSLHIKFNYYFFLIIFCSSWSLKCHFLPTHLPFPLNTHPNLHHLNFDSSVLMIQWFFRPLRWKTHQMSLSRGSCMSF